MGTSLPTVASPRLSDEQLIDVIDQIESGTIRRIQYFATNEPPVAGYGMP
jgi:hypothetical protein